MKHLVVLLVFVYSGASSADSLCVFGEVDYFSCKLENSKVASICGSPLKDSKTFEVLDSGGFNTALGRVEK